MQKHIAQTNQHTQEQTALVKQEVARATHELQQQTSAKDAEKQCVTNLLCVVIGEVESYD